MLVTKILEGTLSAGQTIITFTDSDIPNSFIRVGSTNPDLFPTEQSISGNVLTIKYEAQSSALGVVVELVKAGMTINDSLTSTATDEALSAAQGKALKDLIDNMPVPSIEELTDVNITDPATDDILIYDGTEEEWVNTSMPNIPADIDDLQDVVITSPSDDDVLTYDNGEWVNRPAQGGAGVNYSTTEQNTGVKWINGKDIYMKVIQPNITTSSTLAGDIKYGSFSLSSYISNVDMAWIDTSMSYIEPSTNATRGFVSAQYEKDNGNVTVSTLFARSNVPSTIVVRYTKSS